MPTDSSLQRNSPPPANGGPNIPVWVVSELYYPEKSATGYFLTNIAEGLARRFSVRVLSAQPTYEARGVKAPRSEKRNGVTIRRCFSTTFDKDVLVMRFINLVTLSVSMFFRGVKEFRKKDIVIVVTNPPTLPYSILLATLFRGARCWLLVHDVYPDVLAATGMITKESMFWRVLSWFSGRLYRGMDHIIVLGRDMRKLVEESVPHPNGKVSIIHNWGDTERVVPAAKQGNGLLAKLGLLDKFVVQYSGNMGRTHGLEYIVEAASLLSANERIHFLLIGSGAKKNWLHQQVAERVLSNVTILPPQDRDSLGVSLTACDIAIVTFMPGMAGVSVPSRMYNILAAGRPVLAVADADSELAKVVLEERIGWVVPPGDVEGLAKAVREASERRAELEEMGGRARNAAVTKYSYEQIMRSYNELVSSKLAVNT